MPSIEDWRAVLAAARRCPHCDVVIDVSLARHVADTGSATECPEWSCAVLFAKRNRGGPPVTIYQLPVAARDDFAEYRRRGGRFDLTTWWARYGDDYREQP